MKTGLGHARESIDRAKAKSAQTFSPSRALNYFSFKDGEKKILRFLTDDLLIANFYEFICGNDGRPHDFIYAPDIHGAGTEDFVAKYGGKAFERGMSGPLVEPKPKERIVGIAVLRDEAPSAGRGIQVVDHTETVDVNGKSYQSRWFGVVKQASGNFWDGLLYVADRMDGSLCKRDWEVKREGGGLDTKYHFIALDPDPDLSDVETVQRFYGYGKECEQEDPDRYLYCPQTIPQWAGNYANEERAKYWLGPKGGLQQESSSGLGEFGKGTSHNDEAQAQPPGGTEFSSLKDRLLHNQK